MKPKKPKAGPRGYRKRYQVSLSAPTFAWIQREADARGVTHQEIVEQACARVGWTDRIVEGAGD